MSASLRSIWARSASVIGHPFSRPRLHQYHTTRPAWLKTSAILAVVATACGGGSPKPSEAFCADLHKGFTPFQIYGDVKERYTPAKFADLAYGFASISCPSELKSNESLRTFLLAWDINPDI